MRKRLRSFFVSGHTDNGYFPMHFRSFHQGTSQCRLLDVHPNVTHFPYSMIAVHSLFPSIRYYDELYCWISNFYDPASIFTIFRWILSLGPLSWWSLLRLAVSVVFLWVQVFVSVILLFIILFIVYIYIIYMYMYINLNSWISLLIVYFLCFFSIWLWPRRDL